MSARLRADLVVGGLWEGAPCVDEESTGAGGPYLDGRMIVNGEDGWLDRVRPSHLILNDPLGLGLAGLAARVAERLAYDWHNTAMHGAIEVVDGWCAHSGRASDSVEEGLVDASTYLALTDRLCAAVGLTLAPGEVARWFWHTAMRCWVLKTAAGDLTFAVEAMGVEHHVPDLAGLGPDDWQAALEAAIAEVTCA